MKQWRGLIIPLIALLTALALTIAVTALQGEDVLAAVGWLLFGSVRNSVTFTDLIGRSSLLIISGLAACMAFRAGTFNLGGEGQALAGGLAAAALALLFPNLSRFVALPAALLTGAVAGALIGGFSGFLRAKWGVDELISTFLVAAAIAPVGRAMLGGIMKDAESYLIAAPPLPPAYQSRPWWPHFHPGPSVLLSLIAVVAVAYFLNYTRRGYEWRLRGVNARFARYVGLKTGGIALAALASSGALYGVAGVCALMGFGQAVEGFTSGLGWDGLAVTLIAGNRTAWVPLAALCYTWLVQGTRLASMHTAFPFSLAGMVQAVIFLLVTVRPYGRRQE